MPLPSLDRFATANARDLQGAAPPSRPSAFARIGRNFLYGAADFGGLLARGLGSIIPGNDPLEWIGGSLEEWLQDHPDYAPDEVANAWDLVTNPTALVGRVAMGLPYVLGTLGAIWAGGVAATAAGASAIASGVGLATSFALGATVEARRGWESAKADGQNDTDAEIKALTMGIVGGVAAVLPVHRLFRVGTYHSISSVLTRKIIGKLEGTGIVEQLAKANAGVAAGDVASAVAKDEFFKAAKFIAGQTIIGTIGGSLDDLSSLAIYGKPLPKDYLDRLAQLMLVSGVNAEALGFSVDYARGVKKSALFGSEAEQDLIAAARDFEEPQVTSDLTAAIHATTGGETKTSRAINTIARALFRGLAGPGETPGQVLTRTILIREGQSKAMQAFDPDTLKGPALKIDQMIDDGVFEHKPGREVMANLQESDGIEKPHWRRLGLTDVDTPEMVDGDKLRAMLDDRAVLVDGILHGEDSAQALRVKLVELGKKLEALKGKKGPEVAAIYENLLQERHKALGDAFVPTGDDRFALFDVGKNLTAIRYTQLPDDTFQVHDVVGPITRATANRILYHVGQGRHTALFDQNDQNNKLLASVKIDVRGSTLGNQPVHVVSFTPEVREQFLRGYIRNEHPTVDPRLDLIDSASRTQLAVLSGDPISFLKQLFRTRAVHSGAKDIDPQMFLDYLRTNRAPGAELQQAFADMAEFITNVYGNVRVDVPESIRARLDQLFFQDKDSVAAQRARVASAKADVDELVSEKGLQERVKRLKAELDAGDKEAIEAEVALTEKEGGPYKRYLALVERRNAAPEGSPERAQLDQEVKTAWERFKDLDIPDLSFYDKNYLKKLKAELKRAIPKSERDSKKAELKQLEAELKRRVAKRSETTADPAARAKWVELTNRIKATRNPLEKKALAAERDEIVGGAGEEFLPGLFKSTKNEVQAEADVGPLTFARFGRVVFFSKYGDPIQALARHSLEGEAAKFIGEVMQGRTIAGGEWRNGAFYDANGKQQRAVTFINVDHLGVPYQPPRPLDRAILEAAQDRLSSEIAALQRLQLDWTPGARPEERIQQALGDIDVNAKPEEYGRMMSFWRSTYARLGEFFGSMATELRLYNTGRKTLDWLISAAHKGRTFAAQYFVTGQAIASSLTKAEVAQIGRVESGFLYNTILTDPESVPPVVRGLVKPPTGGLARYKMFVGELRDSVSEARSLLMGSQETVPVPRVPTDQGWIILREQSGERWHALHRAVERWNPGVTIDQLSKDIPRILRGERGEFVRYIPDVITTKFGDVQIFQGHQPLRWLNGLITKYGMMLGMAEAFGPRVMAKDLTKDQKAVRKEIAKAFGVSSQGVDRMLSMRGSEIGELLDRGKLVKLAKKLGGVTDIETSGASMLWEKILQRIRTPVKFEDVIGGLREAYRNEGGSPTKFDHVIELASGAPVWGKSSMGLFRTGRALQTAVQSAQTSLMAIPNSLQVGMLVPIVGVRRFLQGMSKVLLDPLYARYGYQALGAFRHSVLNLHGTSGEGLEGLGNKIRELTSSALFSRYFVNKNNQISVSTGIAFANDILDKGLGRHDEFLLRRTYGMSEKDVADIKAGKLATDRELYSKLIQRHLIATEFIGELPFLRSAMELNPWARAIFPFMNYSVGMGKMVKGIILTAADSLRSRDPKAILRSVQQVTSLVAVAGGVGLASMILRQAVKGNFTETKRRIEQEGHLSLMAGALYEVGVLGPVQRMLTSVEYNGESPPESFLVSLSPSIRALSDGLGVLMATGKFGQFGPGKRVSEAVLNHTPVARAFRNWVDEAAYPEIVGYRDTRRRAMSFVNEGKPKGGQMPINPEYYGVFEMLARDDLEGAIDERDKLLQRAIASGVDTLAVMEGLKTSLANRAPMPIRGDRFVQYVEQAKDFDTLRSDIVRDMRYRIQAKVLTW